MAAETTTAGREFVRRFINTLPELQLQEGIYRRIETLMNEFADEHPNLRGSYVSREVDESYFPSPDYPVEAITRPSLQAIAIESEQMYEFVVFAHGLRRDVIELKSIVHIQETWLEPKPAEPFVLKVSLLHSFGATTILQATTGEAQDMVQEFIAKLKYLRGW